MTADDIRELERRLTVMARAVARKSHFDVSQADLDFHRLLWEKCGNRTLLGVLENVTAPLFAFVSILRSSQKQDMKMVVPAHQPIIAAVALREPQAIRESIRQHLENSYNEFMTGRWKDFESMLQSRAPRERAMRKRG